MAKTAWFDPSNHNHDAQGHACPTCGAGAGAPCVSVVPSFGHGTTGATLRGLHAARVALTVPAPALTGNVSTERAA